MKIGYLHMGFPEHGICRHSRLLATEAKRQPNISVTEANVELTDDLQLNKVRLIEAAQKLNQADVVHFQHNQSLWGGRHQLTYLKVFSQHCPRPLVVTLHDIYLKSPSKQKNLIDYCKIRYGQTQRAYRWLLKVSQQLIVSTEQESKRLKNGLNIKVDLGKKLEVIPLCVENRSKTVSPKSHVDDSMRTSRRTMALLGWIHPRKGHQLVIDALPRLPKDVKVIFAGDATEKNRDFVNYLQAIAKTQGLSDRLEITGYLSEQELEKILLTTDLAICPFKEFSASASLSSWISVAHPKILVSAQPQIEEYNDAAPGSLHTFSPYTPEAFAKETCKLLEKLPTNQTIAIKNLREKLSLKNIMQEHLAYYRRAKENSNLSLG